MKQAVVFYSWGGHTRAVAQAIAGQTGADLFELTPATPYPADYDVTVEQAKAELAQGFLPPLTDYPDLADYDMIYLGSPNWWSHLAPPVTAFLSKATLGGKRISPFITHGGGGISRCYDDVSALCPAAVLGEALVIWDGEERDLPGKISRWLAE